jgi:single-stranded DNA-binding protein
MSSVGLNKWIVSGNLAADAEIKAIELKSGEKAKVAEATIYVRKPRSRDESFTVKLSIWENSTAWRKLPFLKKGSLIICTGNLEPNPYVSKTDNQPKAGLSMNVLDIDLDNVRNADEETEQLAQPVATLAKRSTTSPAASAKGTSTPATTILKAVLAQPAATEPT